MIGLWGMGGVGRTTLLKRINNHPEVESAGYNFVIWVVVSQEFNLERLQRDIAKRVGLLLEERNATTESQAQSLHHFLKNKRVLLLLDDVWQEFDLQQLGFPDLHSSDNKLPISKVVFTTRSEDVCERMAAFPHQGRHMKINVECLKPEEAWGLFFANTGETVQNLIKSDGRVRDHAQTVANKCAGLPLALVVIARAMSSNMTYHQWEDAVNSINDLRHLPKLWVEGTDPLYPVLKVSYDRLLNDQMRKCFLCCALWPEDYDIQKDELIQCWLGMGLIADFSNINVAISKGHSIIEGLKGAAMLEEIVTNPTLHGGYRICVKLHDIIRGMALWIASDHGENRNRWIVRTGVKTNTVIAHEAEIISLMFSEVNNLSQFPYCPNLTALMLKGTECYEDDEDDDDEDDEDEARCYEDEDDKDEDVSRCYEEEDVDVDGCFIKNIHAITYLNMSDFNWRVGSLVDSLEHLKFYSLIMWRRISWEGGVVPRVFFQNLSVLTFERCDWLEDVSWIAQLPYLEILIIDYCAVLERVFGGAENDDEVATQEQDGIETEAAAENRVKILPNLKILKLRGLFSLRTFCSPQTTFPSLQHAEIYQCWLLDLSFLKETKAQATFA